MTTAQDIYDYLNTIAPFDTARPTDNVGFTMGRVDRELRKVFLVMDVTAEIIAAAVEAGADMILSHHPVIYHPIRKLPERSPAWLAARHDITLLAAHTNLDVARGGVNETYLTAIGLEKLGDLPGTDGCASLCRCPEALSDGHALAAQVRKCTGLPCVKLADSGRRIRTVAVCCGGGASFFEQAVAAGVDAFITGDLRHDNGVDAHNLGMTLIDAGHYETEQLVLAPLASLLAERFPDVEFLRPDADRPIYEYIF